MWAILDRGETGRTYLIGADGERTNLDLMREICRLMGVGEDGFDHVTDRPGHDLRYAIDASRTREELGWAPLLTDLREGLQHTIDWYSDHRDWWEPVKERVEARYAATERVL